ncbi:MAG: glycosyltransferase family protein [Marinobacter adhaerens]
MRIAYLVGEDLDKHPGLKYKIDKQIRFWESGGHEVYRVLHSLGRVESPDGGDILQEKVPDFGRKIRWFSLFKKLTWQYRFIYRALKYVQPDLSYTRYLFPARGITLIAKPAGKLIMEVNSDDRSEYMQNNKVSGLFNLVFRPLFLKKISGFVFVSFELRNCRSFRAYHAASKTVISNGIDILDFPFREHSQNNKPALVFVGSPGQTWHGLDKIKFIADRLNECTINIVGPGSVECERIWGSLPSNVICHGYLKGKEVKELLSTMDLGIGTLALHRKNMNEACPLKVRQYLAHGLPVINGCRDSDLRRDKKFYLELPNSENNVILNIEKIERFVYDVFGNSDMRKDVRDFARSALANDFKEAGRVAFFKEVISK